MCACCIPLRTASLLKASFLLVSVLLEGNKRFGHAVHILCRTFEGFVQCSCDQK